MSYILNDTAIVDTSFWFALLDERDQYYKEAQGKVETLVRLQYILPWPILYETLCTRFVRRRLVIRKFESFLKTPSAIYLEDGKYRNDALHTTLSEAARGGRAMSMVDNVIRMMMEDTNVRVDYIFTFNLRDFSDVCARRHVEVI